LESLPASPAQSKSRGAVEGISHPVAIDVGPPCTGDGHEASNRERAMDGGPSQTAEESDEVVLLFLSKLQFQHQVKELNRVFERQ
jgi:hypothetical protein